MSDRNDPAGWMWVQACDLIDQAERLQRRFFQPVASERAVAVWEPPADVFEDGAEIVIVVAMPGVVAERIEVVREPGALLVRGVRPLPPAASGRTLRQLEIPYGRFERRIRLPSTPLDLGAPQLSHGCLIVTLRKIERDGDE
jgi:HSP20 family molecular chaperone IbpA